MIELDSRTMKFSPAVALIIFTLCGCGKNSANSVSPSTELRPVLKSAPEIVSGEQLQGFVDCRFYFENRESFLDGHMELHPVAIFKGKQVGFTISFDSKWQSETHEAGDLKLTGSSGRISFQRSGAESDEFVAALAKIYGLKNSPKKMKDEVWFEAVCLQGNPKSGGNKVVEIKMFFSSKNQSESAEFFLNIDEAHHTIEISEKDPEYRSPMILALSK